MGSMGRTLALACAVALCGCDVVFGVDRLYECPLDDDDCDELLDAVDPCPADPGGREDEDGDEVGDACDPNLGVATDRLLDFDGFHGEDPRWTERVPASWHIRNSTLVLEAGAVERAVEMNSQPTVELVAEPRFVAEGDVVGVYVASKTSTGILLECRVEHHAAGDDLVMILTDPATDAQLVEIGRATQLPGNPRDGLRIYGGQLSSLQVIRCRARYGDSDALFVDWESFGTPVDFDTVGMRVLQQATAAYGSVTIFTTVLP
jgi:hypothetical protein